MTAGMCRDAGVPGHACSGTTRQFIAGSLCETSAPPLPAPPPRGTTAVDLAARKAAVAAFLDRARRLSAVEVDRINELTTDVGWGQDVDAMCVELGWRDPAVLDDTLREAHGRSGLSIGAHAAAFVAWRQGRDAGRRTGLHRASLSVLAWTAAAVASRDVLTPDVYAGVTAIWRVSVGHAHPDDGTRGAPLRPLDLGDGGETR